MTTLVATHGDVVGSFGGCDSWLLILGHSKEQSTSVQIPLNQTGQMTRSMTRPAIVLTEYMSS
jgi:hypothetical protein